jgi:RNA polymerase sigma factor (sigma-70 family)
MLDFTLLQAFQKNDRSAQRSLFEHYYQKLMGIALRYAKNEQQAKDMLIKGFSKICAEAPELKKDQDFETWITKKMVEYAVNYLRERRQEYFITSTIRISEEPKNEFDLFHQQLEPDENTLKAQDYIKALQMLPPSFRAVYNMSVIEGYSDEEVSKNLEISVDTCRYNLSKAKSAYYKNLQQVQSAA